MLAAIAPTAPFGLGPIVRPPESDMFPRPMREVIWLRRLVRGFGGDGPVPVKQQPSLLLRFLVGYQKRCIGRYIALQQR